MQAYAQADRVHVETDRMVFGSFGNVGPRCDQLQTAPACQQHSARSSAPHHASRSTTRPTDGMAQAVRALCTHRPPCKRSGDHARGPTWPAHMAAQPRAGAWQHQQWTGGQRSKPSREAGCSLERATALISLSFLQRAVVGGDVDPRPVLPSEGLSSARNYCGVCAALFGL